MYDEFATVYDEFMDDFDYPAWADYYWRCWAAVAARAGRSANAAVAQARCRWNSSDAALS